MSSSIESRILEMRFDNEQFEGAAKETLETLSSLKNSLDNSVTTTAFDDLDRAARAVDLSGLQNGIEALTDRFSTLGIVGMRVIENLTDSLMNTLRRGFDYAFDAISTGGLNRAMNIENARFQLEGLIGDIEGADQKIATVMQNAMDSVTDTAYGYDEAAKAASMFYASGIEEGPQMENALKAIAGVAATTSSDYESMSRIFTTVAGNGRLMGDQLLQLSTRGMNAAAALKDYFNGVSSGAIQASDSIKQMIAKLTGNKSLIESATSGVSLSLEEQYDLTKESLDKEYNAKKKSYDAQYKELQKFLNKEYNAKKEELNKAYTALQEQLSAELEAAKEAYSDRIEAANNSYQAEVEAHQRATDAKIANINEEYLESIKLIDEEKYNRLKAIDDQIKAINKQAEAEEKARELSEEETKRSEIQKILSKAKNNKTRKQAEQALAEFEAEVAQKRLKEQRKETLEQLNEEKSKINEEAQVKKEAAAKKKEEATKTVQEENNATLKAMQESHKKEIAQLQAEQKENIKAIQASNKERLASFKASQNEELEALKESQNLKLESTKEYNNEQLSEMKKAQTKQLKVLKEALKEEKKATKTYGDGLAVTEQDIRQMVSDGLINFELFSEAMATTFGDHAKDANKTFSGAMANIRAALARTGAAFYQPLIEQEGPMVKLFNAIQEKVNDLNKVLAGPTASLVDKAKDSLAALTDWVQKLDIAVYKDVWNGEKWEKQYDHMGKTAEVMASALRGVFNIFKALRSVIKPIIEAFGEVFNPNPKPLYDAIDSFESFTEKLILSDEQAGKLRTTFVKVFSILKEIGRVGAKGFETLTVVAKGLYDVITPVVQWILKLFGIKIESASDLGDFFVGLADSVQEFFENLEFSSFSTEKLREKFKTIYDVVKDVANGLIKILHPLMEPVKKVGEGLLDILRSADPIQTFFHVLNSFLVTDLILNFRKVLDNISSLVKVPPMIVGKIKKSLDNLNIQLQALTIATDAGALKDIAIALGILAASMFVLSTIDGPALARSLGAVTALLAELVGVFWAISEIKLPSRNEKGGFFGMFDSVSDYMDSLRKSNLTKSIFELAGALVLLSIAVAKLGKLNPDELVSGFVAVSLLLWELVGVFAVLSKIGGVKGMFSIGTGLLMMGLAVGVLTKSVAKLGEMDYRTLIKGLTSVGVLLLELGIFVNMVGGYNKMFSIGLGLLLVAEALKVMTKAVIELGSLSIQELAKGLTSIGILLLELGLFVDSVGGSEKMISTSVGILIIASAIKMLGGIIIDLAQLDWNGVAKGLVAIGVALAEMVIAIKALSEVKNLLGVVISLIILASALEVIADVIIKIGSLDWNGVAKGLVGIAGSLAVISLLADELPNDMIFKSLGLIVLGEALKIVADVIVKLATLDWGGIGKGLLAIGGFLLEVAVFADAIPNDLAIKAVGLIVMGAALEILADVMGKLGQLSLEQIGHGLLAMGGALAEFVIALKLLSDPMAIAGAAAVTIMALAMRILTPALMELSTLNWDQVEVALTAMAGALVILGTVATALGVFAPEALAGAGVLFAFALSLSASVGMLSTVIPKFIFAINLMNNIDHEQFFKNVKLLAESFSEFGKALKDFGLLSKHSAESMSIVADAINKLVKPMGVFIKLDSKKLKNTFKILSDAFADFGDALHEFGLLSGVGAKAMSKVADAINKLVPGMMIFSRLDPLSLALAFKVLSTAFADFGEALHEFGLLSGIGASAMLKVGEAINKMAPALMMLTLVPTNVLSRELTALAKAFGEFGESLDEFGIFSGFGADAMVDVAEAISKMTPALVALSQLDLDDLARLMRILGHAFRDFAKALDEVPFWGATSRAEGIGALIGNIEDLAAVLPAFIELDQDKAATALRTIGQAFKDFGEALSDSPWFYAEERAEGIGALISNIDLLTASLPGFMELDAQKASDALDILGTAFKGFADALDAAPFWGVKGRATGIQTLVESIDILTTGLDNFIGTLDGKDTEISSALDVISDAFTRFGTALESAPLWNADKRGYGIASLVNSIKNLANGLNYFINELDEEQAKAALETIGNAFKTFGEAISSAPLFNNTGRTIRIKTLIASIKDLADNVKYFIDEVGIDDAPTILTSLGNAFKDFGEAIGNTPFWSSTKRAEALISIINSISSISEPLNEIAKIPTDTLSTILTSLEAMFISFADTLDGMKAGATTMASALATMVNSIGVFSGIDTEKLGVAIAQVKSFVAVLEDILDLDTDKMNGVSTSLVNIADTAIKSFANEFKTLLPSVLKAVGDMLSSVNSKISEYQQTFYNQGVNTVSKYLLGMMYKKNDVYHMGETIGNNFIDGLKRINDQMERAGRYVVEGFVRGIRDNIRLAESAGGALGHAAYEAARRSLEVQSPSRKMMEVGSYAGEGFVNGFTEWIKAAMDAGTDIGDSAQDGLKDAIKNIGDQIQNEKDFNPTITPVLDLSNIAEGAKEIGGMINLDRPLQLASSAGLSFSGGLNNILSGIQASIPEDTNYDVVESINGLRSDLSLLSARVQNLQVVMDTGELVGVLTDPIDQQIGYYTTLSERGVR